MPHADLHLPAKGGMDKEATNLRGGHQLQPTISLHRYLGALSARGWRGDNAIHAIYLVCMERLVAGEGGGDFAATVRCAFEWTRRRKSALSLRTALPLKAAANRLGRRRPSRPAGVCRTRARRREARARAHGSRSIPSAVRRGRACPTAVPPAGPSPLNLRPPRGARSASDAC